MIGGIQAAPDANVTTKDKGAQVLGKSLYRKRKAPLSGNTRSGRRRSKRTGLFAFMFLSIVLLTLSRINHDVVEEFRGGIAKLATPAFEVISKPILQLRRGLRNGRTLLTNVNELDRLKLENQKLQQWKWRAKQLEIRLNSYAKIIQAVERPPLGFVTGRVVSEGRGPFIRSVLLNAGRNDGVRNGYPVVSAEGLVGRVVNSGLTASHVLLLTDLNSRIPVEIGSNRTRAILRGDNGPAPRLTYISKGAKIIDGEDVFTSGQGGLLPRGLRIGKVNIGHKFYRVALFSDPGRLEYLSVLFFNTPGIDIADPTGASSRPRRLEQPVASGRKTPNPADSLTHAKRSSHTSSPASTGVR